VDVLIVGAAASGAVARRHWPRHPAGIGLLAGRVGPTHPFAGVLRGGCLARFPPRCQVGTPTDRRTTLDDAIFPVGAWKARSGDV